MMMECHQENGVSDMPGAKPSSRKPMDGRASQQRKHLVVLVVGGILIFFQAFTSLSLIASSLCSVATTTFIASLDATANLTGGNISNGISKNIPLQIIQATHPEDYSKRHRNNVIVFVSNARYAAAAADSVTSVRKDGGYDGDILILLDTDVSTENMTALLNNNMNNTDDRLFLMEASELLDDFLGQDSDYQRLRDPPESMSCVAEHRNRGRRGYYLKTLVFHPRIASRWDSVLCMLLLSRQVIVCCFIWKILCVLISI
jgi:hypothetical protein